uniref:Uncharacterized protein n=1 Tax=Phlebotomus papatasi TaxID=29031 RepID=A0A1B0DC08_PHLPP
MMPWYLRHHSEDSSNLAQQGNWERMAWDRTWRPRQSASNCPQTTKRFRKDLPGVSKHTFNTSKNFCKSKLLNNKEYIL